MYYIEAENLSERTVETDNIPMEADNIPMEADI